MTGFKDWLGSAISCSLLKTYKTHEQRSWDLEKTNRQHLHKIHIDRRLPTYEQYKIFLTIFIYTIYIYTTSWWLDTSSDLWYLSVVPQRPLYCGESGTTACSRGAPDSRDRTPLLDDLCLLPPLPLLLPPSWVSCTSLQVMVSTG